MANPNHDDKGRFSTGSGGGAAPQRMGKEAIKKMVIGMKQGETRSYLNRHSQSGEDREIHVTKNSPGGRNLSVAMHVPGESQPFFESHGYGMTDLTRTASSKG